MLRPLAFLAAAGFTLLLSGCGKKDSPASATPAATASASGSAKKILHFGNGGEPQDLDPQASSGIVEHRLYLTFFEGLVAEDPQLNVIPAIAEKWDISPDRLVYTFHLRASAKWSNGEPITAEDFVQSYKRILTASLGAEYAYMLWLVAGAEDYHKGRLTDFAQTGFKAVDPRTLRITLRQPAPFLLHAMAFYPWFVVPVKTIAKSGGLERKATAWTRPGNMVCSGAYVLTEWRQNQKIVAVRNPHYWDRDRVKIDEVHFYPVELADTEERMFRTGQLDITNEVPLTKIPVYQRENPGSLRIDPWNGVYFYRFNVKRKPFDDVRVRRALALAIDREALVRDVTLGGELPAYHLVPPNMAGYTSRHKIAGDVAEAKRLLAEAGYPDGRGFPPVELLYNTLERHRVIAEALQQQWRRNLGIEITLFNQEWKVYMDSQHAKNFQIQRAGWIADYVDPHVYLDLWETDGGNNDSNWGDPEYDRLLRAALNAKSDAERYEIYQQMEKIFLEAMPVMPIYFYTKARLVNPRVQGYFTTLTDNLLWKFADLKQ